MTTKYPSRRPAIANGAYAMKADDIGGLLQIDASAGAVNVQMLPAYLLPDQRVSIQKLDSSTHVVTLFFGAAYIGALTTKFNTITFHSDGTSWYPVSSF